jgi:hypothetical protein
MGPLIIRLLLGLAVCGAAVYAMGEHNAVVNKLEFENARERLRSAFTDRAGYVRSLASEDRYRDELAAVTKWYAAEVSAVYNRFPGTKDPDRTLNEIEKAVDEGRMKPAEAELRKEFFDETKQAFDLIASGKYNPLATSSQNGVRFDLVSMRRDMHEGQSRLRVDFTLWGAPRRETVQKSPDGKQGTVKTTLDFGLRSLGLEFVDAKSKLLGGGNAGPPTILVEVPERWIQDFPPQFAVGTWWIDPFPREAESVLLKIDGELRPPGAPAIPVGYEWKLANREAWMLREGEAFEGEERTMPEEDLQR